MSIEQVQRRPMLIANREQFARSAPTETSAAFVREVHEAVRDLFAPNLWIFFADFLTSIVVSYAAVGIYLTSANGSWQQVLGFVVGAFAMYRAVIFIHEIEHRPPGTFRAFIGVWNVLCGIPLMMPSFLYDNHTAHHSNQSYGTHDDSEYLSLARRRWLRALFFLSLAAVYPLLGITRFLWLTPLAAVRRPADRKIWKLASSLYMLNPDYRRKWDARATSVGRWVQEIVCCALAWTLAVLTIRGVIGWDVWLKIYLLFLAWMGLNQLRTLTAHRYTSVGEPWNYADQVLDSNTFPRGGLWAELWAPVGLRYHALHHVMPALPYHALPEGHRRLMARLPADSPYRRTIQPGLWAATVEAFTGRRTATK
jgi:fatty acid desaturase